MIFQVWHNERPSFDDSKPIDFPNGFAHVANVECAEFEQVFELTNHIHSNWTKNAGVTMISGQPARSTSVGDVVVDPEGVPHMCCSNGWRPIE